MVKDINANNDKAQLFAYVGSVRGAVRNEETGENYRNQWVRLNLRLKHGEVVEKLSWRAEDWGSNNIVITKEDLATLVGEILTLCDAMIGDKEQRDAWKKLLRSKIYQWHDTKFNRFQVDKLLDENTLE